MIQALQVAGISIHERIGLAFIGAAAALSSVPPLILMVHLLFRAVRDGRAVRDPQSQASRPGYFRGQMHFYFFSLLFADMMQGLGGLINWKWVSDGEVTAGAVCRAQAALKQVGDVGVALSILAITLHTFFVLFFYWQPPDAPWLAVTVLGVIWTFVILIATVPYGTKSNFYGITGFWCWITDEYPVERIAFDYGWIWATALLNVLLYIPLFFALRGNIVVSHRRRHWCLPQISLELTAHGCAYSGSAAKSHMRIARSMLYYPIIYLVTILPSSIARFMSYDGYNVPYQATIVCALLFACSGLFNVLLFTLTRPALVPGIKTTAAGELSLLSFQRGPPVPSKGYDECATGTVMSITNPRDDIELYISRKSDHVGDGEQNI